MCCQHVKFIVTKLDPQKPLSFYISPTIIKEYIAKDDFEITTINDNVKVIKMSKKNTKSKKK
jgi:hypothetical protein